MPATKTRPVVLLICDDHRVLTDALAMVVDNDPTLELLGPPVHDPQSAIDIASEQHPDVVLMDVTFRGSVLTGIDATRLIKKASPETNIVVMTANEDDRLMVDAVEAGATGFLAKSEAVDGLMSAVRGAAAGELLIDQPTLKRLLRQVRSERRERQHADERIASLTAREMETLTLLTRGARTDEIAADLNISSQTVQTHVRNVLRKLDVHSKLEAVAFAVKYGAVHV